MSNPIKCVLYARISTKEGDPNRTTGPHQSPDSQLYDLENYAKSHGMIIHRTYIDRITGVSEGSDRPEFSKLLKDIRSSKPGFGVVLFHSISRLGRGGVLQICRILETFTANGIRYVSYTEPYLSSLGEFGEVVVALLAIMAKIERGQLSDRVRAGLANAKARGRHIGRKTIPVDDVALRKLVESGGSVSDVARVFSISRATAARRLKEKGLITQGMGELVALNTSSKTNGD